MVVIDWERRRLSFAEVQRRLCSCNISICIVLLKPLLRAKMMWRTVLERHSLLKIQQAAQSPSAGSNNIHTNKSHCVRGLSGSTGTMGI